MLNGGGLIYHCVTGTRFEDYCSVSPAILTSSVLIIKIVGRVSIRNVGFLFSICAADLHGRVRCVTAVLFQYSCKQVLYSYCSHYPCQFVDCSATRSWFSVHA
jgi:hypothetical protein